MRESDALDTGLAARQDVEDSSPLLRPKLRGCSEPLGKELLDEVVHLTQPRFRQVSSFRRFPRPYSASDRSSEMAAFKTGRSRSIVAQTKARSTPK